MKIRKKFGFILGLLGLGLLQLAIPQSASAWVGAATGGYHTIALAEDGTVWASGENWQGALGNGTKVNSDIPVQSLGLSNVISVAAGDTHSYAIKNDGTVWTWGLFYSGGGAPDRRIPTLLPGLGGVTQLAAGGQHSLVLKGDGTVWGWGRGISGELGNLSVLKISEYFETPVQASGLSGITQIAAGVSHSLAVKNDGTVWGWGDNGYNQVGDAGVFVPIDPGDTQIVPEPIQLPGLANIVQVAGGFYHSAALDMDGNVWCWGTNTRGQLGAYGVQQTALPVKVENLDSVVAIAAGGEHTLAIRQDGTLWAWGYNTFGQLGDSTLLSSGVPVKVIGLSNILSVSAGREHTVALDGDGNLWTWGASEYGQLGAGELRYVTNLLMLPSSGLGTKAIGVGYHHAFRISTYGSVDATGDNTFGQLGLGPKYPINITGQVENFYQAVQATGGEYHSVALKTNGTVWSWGDNSKGQLGVGGTVPSINKPLQVAGLTGASAVAAGKWHSLAIISGAVWAWGDNSNGQLGNGELGNSPTPLLVAGLSNVAKVAGGEGHSIALTQGGSVYQWGAGLLAPTPLSGLTSIVDIAAGENHSLAVKNDGTVYSWVANSTSPVVVSGLAGVVKVAAGKSHSLVLKGDGSLWTWGANNRGQLGDGTVIDRNTPVRVLTSYRSTTVTGFKDVWAGGNNSYAFAEGGRTYCWGDGNSHQFWGSGPDFYQSNPLQFGVTNYSTPEMQPLTAKTAVVGKLSAFKVIGSDRDGNNITYTAEGLPPSAEIDPESGAISILPTTADLGAYKVTVNVTDDGLPEPKTVSQPVSLWVLTGNRPPVLNPLDPVKVYVGAKVTFKVTATDPDGDAITLSASGLPSGARFDPATGLFSWTPASTALAFNGGVYAPRFWAADSGSPARSTSARFTITVMPYNYAPVIAPIPPLTVKAGTRLVYKFSATDANGDLVTISATGLPSGARLDIGSGTLTWTPTIAQAAYNGGLYKFRLTATDNSYQPKIGSTLVPVTVTQ